MTPLGVANSAVGSVVDTLVIPAAPSPNQQFLRISEIMFNPAGDDATEFIELTNISGASNPITLHLSGVVISQGPSEPFEFAAGTIRRLARNGDGVMITTFPKWLKL